MTFCCHELLQYAFLSVLFWEQLKSQIEHFCNLLIQYAFSNHILENKSRYKFSTCIYFSSHELLLHEWLNCFFDWKWLDNRNIQMFFCPFQHILEHFLHSLVSFSTFKYFLQFFVFLSTFCTFLKLSKSILILVKNLAGQPFSPVRLMF